MTATVLSKEYWIRIWQLRFFLWTMVQLDLRNRYKRSILGIGWSMLQPILMTVVLCTVFATLFQMDLTEYAPFVVSGLGIWAFIANSMTEGCNSISTGEKYIRAHPMPLAIYPIRTLLSISVQFLIILLLTVVITLFFKGYENPIAIIGIVPSLIILAVFGWSMGVIFGFANIHFPDTLHITVVVLQIVYYLTPIFYPPELINSTIVQTILKYNPLGVYVSIVRDPLVYSRFPPVGDLLYACVATAVCVLLAIRALVKYERTLIFHL